jgi:3'-5' exoribonuclease
MARRFINQLGEHETVREVFLVGNKQLRQNRNGNLYLQMQLSDRTGSVNGMMWNANDHIASTFKNGDFIEIQGTSQFYNGAMQIIVNSLETAKEDSVDHEDFIFVSQQDVESFVAEISELLRGMQNPHLRNLAETFLADEEFMKKLSLAPAAVKHHHAYHGGLLEHVTNLMKVAHAVAPFYPAVDHDLLLMGAFLHDLGKIEELTYQRDLAYSDAGQMIGHLVMGVELVDRKTAEAEKLTGEPLPAALVTRLKHMIVSHHGKYEFGSPKLPMTYEAVALHLLDDLDAKIHQFQQIVDGDVNEDSNWTVFQPSLGRKLFKGS